MTTPRPNNLQVNDWRKAELPSLHDFQPQMPVSVVMPYYQAPREIEFTLAALERQTYPRDLFEVLIVDDGSAEPLPPPDTPLNVRVLYQEDRGFGLARARNHGAREARRDILLFLDCDMMPEADWMAAHARWHHLFSDVLTLGFRTHVEMEDTTPADVREREGDLADMFAGRRMFRPEWIEYHMARTNELTSRADDIFRVLTGGNFGAGKEFFETAGGFDESFTQWGAEDTEFGYRAYARGGLFVPVREAHCWHQGGVEGTSPEEQRSLEEQRAKISHLIPHSTFRSTAPGRSFTVPQFAVTVREGRAGAEAVAETVEKILGGRIHDLMVWVEESEDDPGREWLRRQLEPDPRVICGPAGGAFDAFPTAAFHISIPAGFHHWNTVGMLRNELGFGVRAQGSVTDGYGVSITRSWALHRAERTGLVLSELGEVSNISRRRMETSMSKSVPQGPVRRRLRRLRNLWARVWRELKQVRNPRQAWWFLRWLADAVRWRLVGQSRFRNTYHPSSPSDRSRPAGSGPALSGAAGGSGGDSYSLGAEIASLGGMAAAVFAASDGVSAWLGSGSADVILADRPPAEPPAAPVVVLSEHPARLSVPAFDERRINPVGWVRDSGRSIAALGPRERLPDDFQANLTTDGENLRVLRGVHHVADVAAYHRAVHERAATLTALAGAGAVVDVLDSDPVLEQLLGEEMYGLMTGGTIRNAHDRLRESLSIRLRRLALRDHSLRSRARQVAGAAGLDNPRWPEVSIVAATMRPERLPNLLEVAAGQTYPRLELVLACHGDGFEDATAEEWSSRAGIGVTVIWAEKDLVLGEVLNRASQVAGGDLLTKMDDDDLYDGEHVWDLVLAREYSGAQVTGKGAEYVYLADSDKTIHRFVGKGESYTTTIGGGAMLISARDLQEIGGWRNVPRGVDRALIEDAERAGGAVYRTHGSGYVLMRHGQGHTWETGDQYFLEQADDLRHGLDRVMAGIDSPF